MKKTVLAALLLPSLAFSQSAHVSIASQMLEIDGLVVEEMPGRWQATLKGTPSLMQFSVINVSRAQPFPLSSAGTYEGVSGLYESGTTSTLSASPCSTPSPTVATTLQLSLVGTSMHALYELDTGALCNLFGTNTVEGSSGRFMCSDFNQGSWTSDGAQVLNTSISLKLALDGDQCDYDLHYTGLKVN